MAKTTFGGHPVHPILITVPASLLPFSLVLDLMHLATGKRSYAEAAYYSMMGGYVGGMAAAAAGAGDYVAIPPKSRVKKVANLHAALNLAMLGLYSINLLLRKGKQLPVRALPIALSVVGSTGIGVSAWYGGQLVYQYGMRVKGVSPVADAPEIKLPGDEKLERAFQAMADPIPADGPDAV